MQIAHLLLAQADATQAAATTSTPWWIPIPIFLCLGSIAALMWILRLFKEQRDAVQEKSSAVKRLETEQARSQHEVMSLQMELQRAKEEVDHRPQFNEERYAIATMGTAGCGKTALTVKWTNPLVDVHAIGSTLKLQKYDKPVSFQRLENGTRILHLYTIFDRGGELAIDVLDSLVTDEIKALLLVVDVADWDKERGMQVFMPDRIEAQIKRFNHHVLEFLFTAKIRSSCQKYILFINKVDVLQEKFPGSPEHLDQKARELYQKLIDSLQFWGQKYGATVEVLTGSAVSGTGAPQLYSCLLRDILPQDAWDEALQFLPIGYDKGKEKEPARRRLGSVGEQLKK